MKENKEEKGITLVALIITIVVLLILAAVAIGTVKNSSIIGHAKDAANMYKNEKENDEKFLKYYEDKLKVDDSIKIYGPVDNKGYIIFTSKRMMSLELIAGSEDAGVFVVSDYRLANKEEALKICPDDKKQEFLEEVKEIEENFGEIDKVIIIKDSETNEEGIGTYIFKDGQKLLTGYGVISPNTDKDIKIKNKLTLNKGTYSTYCLERTQGTIAYIVDNAKNMMFSYAIGNEQQVGQFFPITISENDTEITVLVDGQPEVIGKENVYKITVKTLEESEQYSYYIAGEKLYKNKNLMSEGVVDGAEVEVLTLDSNFNITEIGLIVQ